LEGRGGGNDGESYHLAWYFAGKHTAIDCFEKRGQKGFLFTIGDEHCLPELPARSIKDIMGCSQANDTTRLELLDKARETYNVYHLHVMEGSNGRSQVIMDGWKQTMGDSLVLVKSHRDIPQIIADIVTQNVGKSQVVQSASGKKPAAGKSDDTSKTEEML